MNTEIKSATLSGRNPRPSGTIIHAVEGWDGESYTLRPAVCGKSPGARSTGWGNSKLHVNCPKCIRAMAKRRPAVTTIYNEKGGVRFEHKITSGRFTDDQGRKCTVVGPGPAGMPEVKFEDGHTEYAFPNTLVPLTDL